MQRVSKCLYMMCIQYYIPSVYHRSRSASSYSRPLLETTFSILFFSTWLVHYSQYFCCNLLFMNKNTYSLRFVSNFLHEVICLFDCFFCTHLHCMANIYILLLLLSTYVKMSPVSVLIFSISNYFVLGQMRRTQAGTNTAEWKMKIFKTKNVLPG